MSSRRPPVERQAVSTISPWGVSLALHLPSHPASNFPCQLYKAVVPWLRVGFLVYEMGCIFPLFRGFGEIKVALAQNVSYRLLGAKYDMKEK